MPHPTVIRTRLLVVLLSVIALAAWRMVVVPRPIRADEPAPRTVSTPVPVAPGTEAVPAKLPASTRVTEARTGPLLFGSGVKSNAGLTGTVVRNEELDSELNPKPTTPAESRGQAEVPQKSAPETTTKPEVLRVLDSARRIPKSNSTQRLETSLRIHASLEQPVSLHVDEVPLLDVIKRISTTQDFNIVLDNVGFDEIGISPTARVSVNVSDIKLRSALSLILEPLGADFVVADDVLTITNQQLARELQTAQDVAALRILRKVDAPELSVPLEPKSECTLHCQSRIKTVDGFNRAILRVSAPSANDLRLQALEAGTTTITVIDEQDHKHTVRVNVRAPDASDEASELEHLVQRLYPTAKLEVVRIRDAMLIRGSVNDQQQAVEIVEIAEQYAPRVLNQLHWPTGPTQPMKATPVLKPPTPVRIPNAVPSTPRVESPSPILGPTPLALDTPPDKSVRDSATVPNRDRRPVVPDDTVRELRNDLRELQRDVRRLIELLEDRQDKPKGTTSKRTRPSDANNNFITKVYAVADLVVPIPGFVRMSLDTNDGQTDQRSAHAIEIGPDAQANFAALMKHIRTEIDPKTWKGADGKGTIGSDLTLLSLIVSQTPAVHEQIAAMLTELRRQFDVQVTNEIRFVTLPGDDNVFSTYLTIMGENQVLRTGQAKRLLEHFQGDTRTNILQSPRVTLFSGQSCEMMGGFGDSTTKLLLHTLVPDGSETVRVRMAINPGDAADA
ncbi:MAG: hypothetical protein HZA46_25305, partial [Planctomycetales bacterium]|nr:hypothetical protein [Planctomycetales bacterium]